MTRILPFFFLGLLWLVPVQAQEWQLDILVFERDTGAVFDPKQSGQFKPIDWPELLPIDNELGIPLTEVPFSVSQAASARGIQILNNTSFSLLDAARKLNSSGRYQVLTQHSLRFPQKTVTPVMRLHYGAPLRLMPREQRETVVDGTEYWRSQPDLAPPIDAETLFGWFQLSHEIHPILSMDMSYLRAIQAAFPLQVTPDGVREYYRDQVNQYRLKSERMLRAGKIAYFDHPQLGVLARLTNLSDQVAP
ncbi:MAG: CsiV family protein [Oceanococcus sp.]